MSSCDVMQRFGWDPFLGYRVLAADRRASSFRSPYNVSQQREGTFDGLGVAGTQQSIPSVPAFLTVASCLAMSLGSLIKWNPVVRRQRRGTAGLAFERLGKLRDDRGPCECKLAGAFCNPKNRPLCALSLPALSLAACPLLHRPYWHCILSMTVMNKSRCEELARSLACS